MATLPPSRTRLPARPLTARTYLPKTWRKLTVCKRTQVVFDFLLFGKANQLWQISAGEMKRSFPMQIWYVLFENQLEKNNMTFSARVFVTLQSSFSLNNTYVKVSDLRVTPRCICHYMCDIFFLILWCIDIIM